jgi:adenosylmethionine-8-amino-7-oxononanoate aminotransferase
MPINSLFSGNLPQHFFVKSPSVDPMEEALADLEATLKQHSDAIATMILEPVVQGAGSMRFYNPQYLLKAKALCEQCTKSIPMITTPNGNKLLLA